MMIGQHINYLLHDVKIAEILKERDRLFWLKAVNVYEDEDPNTYPQLARLTYLLVTYSLDNPEDSNVASIAYRLLRGFPIHDEGARKELNSYILPECKDEFLGFYFILSSLSLQTGRTINARLILSEYTEPQIKETDWGKRVLSDTLVALIYLIRKKDGFSDIRKAIEIINELQSEQQIFESDYLEKYNTYCQTTAAFELLACYHTSKALVETALYIIQGYKYSNKRIDVVIRRHIDLALSLLQKNSKLKPIIDIINNDLKALAANAIWSKTGFQDKIRLLCEKKSNEGILELLPSQQEAFNKNLFDIAANAIILQMPTSAGKTLLAEFNIIVTKSLLPNAKIVYVVPSRALVNQAYHDLCEDLETLGFSISKTSSTNEVDPSENTFISAEDVDILVSTPEKLDLLIRRGHPAVANVSLFIIDEAHMISNGIRGARLELLISMLRRERQNAKFMLLSPFLPGDRSSLQEWLGGGNMIEIDWKPSEKVIMGIRNRGKSKVELSLVPSPYTSPSIIDNTAIIPQSYEIVSTGNKEKLLEFSCKHFAEQGKTMLVLCQGRNSANSVAKQIGRWCPQIERPDSDIELVRKYLIEEIGCETLYSDVLSKRIAIHHAGLSDEAKLLIEHLIRNKKIQYICATSTVAEGVNFPVSTVYFDTYYRGRGKEMTSNDFWNISGRAGRTLVDEYGRIILPFNSSENKEKGLALVNKSAEELASVIAQLFLDKEVIENLLNESDGIESVMNQYPDSFGPLFQYFIHLLNISNNEYVEDIEELFKDTFEYTKLSDVDRVQFINLCKKIYQTIEAKYSQNTGALKYADTTGFSVPSVLSIMRESVHNTAISDIDSWEPENLFDKSNSSNLAEKIKVVATLRETGLGTDSKDASFNPDLVAKMLISWVKGDKLLSISKIHPFFTSKETTEENVSDFVNYMNGACFKSSWGLSALEGIVKGKENGDDESYIPSFVYYGVDDVKSLALRMIGVPRTLAKSLSPVLSDDLSTYTLSSLKSTIHNLSSSDWNAHIPEGSKLSGDEWKRVVNILMKEK